MNQVKRTPQELLVGSSKLNISSSLQASKDKYIITHASENKCLDSLQLQYPNEPAVNKFIELYSAYRTNWHSQPQKYINNHASFVDVPPLCVDIEVASVCDLACPFCYRSYIATPDKLIDDKLAYDLIDQAASLGVPSIKFNWRGEPLMHPRLERFISYAKSKGILETIINTNATHLTVDRASSLIEAGLDVMIYSFDGGTKSTYEKNRPGRFKQNIFEDVVTNIQNFSHIRSKLRAKLPFTKIQMILTEDTFGEQDDFLDLFHDFVDSVTVTQYSERGGNITDLQGTDQDKIKDLCIKHNIKYTNSIAYMKASDGSMSISKNRLPCAQPFQRLLVTYDGRVSMCCYDWGAKYTCGQVVKLQSDDPNYDKNDVMTKSSNHSHGFDLLENITLPNQYVPINSFVGTLSEIWNHTPIRNARIAQINSSNLPDICQKCSFKDTYDWIS